MSKQATFRGLNLQAAPFTMATTGIFSSPPTKQKTVDIGRGDGEVATFLAWGARAWDHNGTLRAEDSDSLEEAIDLLKRHLHKRGTYAIEYAGGMRYIQAVMRNVVISRAATDVSRVGFSADFYAEDPFMTNGETGTLIDEEGVTSGDITFGVTAEGTYLALPIFQLTINSIDPDDSEVEITLSNMGENHALTFAGIFQAGDVITVDCANEEVYQNTTLIEADGLFPLFAPDTGSLRYSDNASTRDVDILGTYEKRYL